MDRPSFALGDKPRQIWFIRLVETGMLLRMVLLLCATMLLLPCGYDCTVINNIAFLVGLSDTGKNMNCRNPPCHKLSMKLFRSDWATFFLFLETLPGSDRTHRACTSKFRQVSHSALLLLGLHTVTWPFFVKLIWHRRVKTCMCFSV